MDCRGQGGSSQDVGGVNGNTQRGHIIRGTWDSPQDLLFRHIFLDTVQLVRVLSTFQEVDDKRLATMGTSQGGALSVACSALSGKIKRTVIQMPFFLILSELGKWVREEMPTKKYMSTFAALTFALTRRCIFRTSWVY